MFQSILMDKPSLILLTALSHISISSWTLLVCFSSSTTLFNENKFCLKVRTTGLYYSYNLALVNYELPVFSFFCFFCFFYAKCLLVLLLINYIYSQDSISNKILPQFNPPLFCVWWSILIFCNNWKAPIINFVISTHVLRRKRKHHGPPPCRKSCGSCTQTCLRPDQKNCWRGGRGKPQCHFFLHQSVQINIKEGICCYMQASKVIKGGEIPESDLKYQ